MNILNQSIAPIGQPPVQPSKGTTSTQEAIRLAPANVSLHSSASAKSSQLSLQKGASVAAAAHSGTSADGKTLAVIEARVQYFNPNMAYSFLDDGKMSLMSEIKIDNNQVSSNTGGVLAVSVTSAVKLDERQINLITRKMQRLTGFLNLSLENTVDPSLIAGLVIRCSNDPSQVIDLSVKNQLAMVAAQIERSDDHENIAGYRHNKTSPNIKR